VHCIEEKINRYRLDRGASFAWNGLSSLEALSLGPISIFWSGHAFSSSLSELTAFSGVFLGSFSCSGTESALFEM